MEVTKTIEIAAPAERVWSVLDDEFGAIDRWAGRMLASAFDADLGPLGGRQVTTVEYGPATETLYARDAERRMIGYWVTGPTLPPPIDSVQTEWRVADGADGGTTVSIRFLAVVVQPEMQPMLEETLRAGMDPFLRHLAHYAETGEPHPDKAAAAVAG